jgi:CDP-glucose 4,6-dehydratase
MSRHAAYAGTRVFVTGHTGFKGAWLTEWLTLLGAEVSGYALEPPTAPNLFDALGLAHRMKHVLGDVRDHDRLSAELRAAQPSIVFHLAAQAIVRRAYGAPRETLETNVMGTVNVLEAARTSSSVRAVVIVTSDKCYDERDGGGPYRETDPMGGRDPYSASKGAAEIVTAAYRSSFFRERIAVASVSAGNVIGGGDWAADRIIPDCVRAVVAGQPVVVRNPDAVRPWQHVLEPLSGYLRLGRLLLEDGRRFEGPWNFGPLDASEARSVRWLVERFLAEWGSGSWAMPADEGRPQHEAPVLRLDSSKARDQLGWRPVWDAPAAIRQTATWYREFHRAPQGARQLVAEQIDAYVREAEGAQPSQVSTGTVVGS